MSPPNRNRPPNGIAQLNARGPADRGPGRPASARYAVQPPVPLTGRAQQIRATLNGTREVAGSVDIRASGAGKAFISNLKVDQQHRRRGVANQLIDAAIVAARRQGFASATLEARPSDNGISPQALVAMYRRQGFKTAGKSHRGSPMMERKLR
jgi:ribosomal protein S18 acetylase RimI-like enzyme